MKLSKRILALALAVVMAVSVFSFASCSSDNLDVPKFSDETIKIGLTGPLTGGAAVYGTAVRNSARLAVSEINAAGGLKVGDKNILFSLEMYDDKHDATQVANLYSKLKSKGMQVSLGTVTTKPGLEFAKLSKDDNLFFITPSATGDAIPANSNGFQMCFADSNQGIGAALYFNEAFVGKTVGVFYKSDDEYSKGIYDNFKKYLNPIFNLDANTATFQGEDAIFSSQIEILKDCDVVFMPIYYTPASQFMTQANSVQNSISVYYGCDGFDGINAIEGFDISTVKQEVSYLTHFTTNATEGPAKTFVDKYNETFNTKKEPVNQFGASAYDCVYAIYEALKIAVANGKVVDGSTSASDMCNILTEVFTSPSFVFRGITGKTVGNEKSVIAWNQDGTVNKLATKEVVKEKTA